MALTCLDAAAFADAASQRQRIERERTEVNVRAHDGEAQCADRFAVSSCLAQVRGERRAALQQLDHQRALLDDAQRKQRASERTERVRARLDAAARVDEARQLPPESPSPRAVAAPAVTALPSDAASDEASERRRAPRAAAVNQKADAARRAAAAKRRAEEAAAHRTAVEQRNRERALQKPPAPPLPLP